MPENTDKRNRLDEEIFTFRITKDKKVFIFWHGKQVTALSGERALDFIDSIKEADARQAQLIMAKATGNFKRGNEKHKGRR